MKLPEESQEKLPFVLLESRHFDCEDIFIETREHISKESGVGIRR